MPKKKDAKRQIQLQDGRKVPFFWIANAVVEKYLWDIGPDAFTVYAVLCKHANNTTQMAWPSQQTIADLIMVSRNTVKKAIRTLKKAKLISVKKEGRVGREHNVYTLLAAKIKGRTWSRRDRGYRMTGSGDDPGGSPLDQAGSRRGHELDVVELDELNESKQGQGIANAMARPSNLNPSSPNLKARKANPPIPAKNFQSVVSVLSACGLNTHKRNCGALRELWNAASGSPEEREAQCIEALETACGMSIEHPEGIFAFALKYLRGEEL
jgi:hypothetical protein